MVIVLTPFYIIYFILSSRWDSEMNIDLSDCKTTAFSHLVSVGMRKPLTLITWCLYFYLFWKLGDPFPILSPKHGVLSVEQGHTGPGKWTLSTVCVSRYKQSRRDRSDHHGAVVWLRSRQLSLHQHEHLHEERQPGGCQQDREETPPDNGDDLHEGWEERLVEKTDLSFLVTEEENCTLWERQERESPGQAGGGRGHLVGQDQVRKAVSAGQCSHPESWSDGPGGTLKVSIPRSSRASERAWQDRVVQVLSGDLKHSTHLGLNSPHQGMYFNFLGYFFSLYCVWKIFISTVNIVFDRVGKMDPITKTFDILVNWIGLSFSPKYFCYFINKSRFQYRRDYVVPAVKFHSCGHHRVQLYERSSTNHV